MYIGASGVELQLHCPLPHLVDPGNQQVPTSLIHKVRALPFPALAKRKRALQLIAPTGKRVMAWEATNSHLQVIATPLFTSKAFFALDRLHRSEHN